MMTSSHVTESPAVLEAEGLTITSPSGRVLVKDLDLLLGQEHVAIVGRNGAGKTTLLTVLAGHLDPLAGRVQRHGRRVLVPQLLPHHPTKSPGERRRHHLAAARSRGPELLLLDEPTEDLDIDGVDELCEWLPRYPGAVLLISHHRQLLRCFRHFFVLEDSGGRYFRGNFDELERDLQARHERGQRRYAKELSHLEARERHDVLVRRRRRRKKNLGRLHEERRGVSRARLGEKKGYAQQSQAKAAKVRDDRIGADRAWAKAARRALAVQLPLALAMPELPPDDGRVLLGLDGITVRRNGRELVAGLDLSLRRERLALVGANGAGKSTLLEAMAGHYPISAGAVHFDAHIAIISQGAAHWIREESLLETLLRASPSITPERATELITAQSFPLGLALRPLASLSAGERTRAALIAVMHQAPELLLLDEPTYSLDFVGTAALAKALAAWPGGLVVASHDRGFLEDVGVATCLRLDGAQPSRGMLTS